MQFNNSGRAIYLQIADYVCEKVLLREWSPEDKIPSVRELSMQMEVNPNTVMRAYEFLKQQEIVYDKRGIGYFISGQALKIAMDYRKAEFTEHEMPAIFRIMHMLGMDIDDLKPKYEKFKKQYSF